MAKFNILNLGDNFFEVVLNFIFNGLVVFLFGKLKENFIFFPQLMDGPPVFYGICENFALFKDALGFEIIRPKIRTL